MTTSTLFKINISCECILIIISFRVFDTVYKKYQNYNPGHNERKREGRKEGIGKIYLATRIWDSLSSKISTPYNYIAP